MTAAQRLAKMQWDLIKAATKPRKLPLRKPIYAETDDLLLRRSQMMRGR